MNAGFDVERVLTADLRLPYYQFKEPEQRIRFFTDVVAKVQTLPGVSHAGLVSLLPLEGESFVDNIVIQGEPDQPAKQPLANFRFVSPGYFETIGIPLKRGRFFEEGDRRKHAALISEQVAQRVLPGEDPIGKNLRWHEQLYEIVGVVGDIRAVGLDQAPVLMAYLPYWENTFMNVVSLSVRTTMDPDAMAGAVRAAIRDVDEGVPTPEIRTMKEIVVESVAPRRFQTLLALLFAGFALVVAALGIYGVLSYSVAQRRQELAIRASLGAGATNLYSLVLRQGLRPVAFGLSAGLAVALAAGRLVSGLLFGVKADDPLAFGVVIASIATAASTACLIPARRAIKVDPMVALRYE